MSHRTNWKVLGRPSPMHDPIPGDPAGIRAAASDCTRIAQKIADAENQLDMILSARLSDGMVSETVDKIRGQARDVRSHIGKVPARYTVAAAELNTYADELAAAQTAADVAEQKAQNAQSAMDAANQRVSRYQKQVTTLKATKRKYDAYQADDDGAPTAQELDANRRDLTRYQGLLQDAQADYAAAEATMADARSAMNAAVARRDKAAQSAADRIRQQIDTDQIKDTLWDECQTIWDAVVGLYEKIKDALVGLFESLVQAVKLFWEAIKDLYEALVTWDFEKLKDAFRGLLQALAALADAISAIAGILALVCLPFPALAGVFAAISKVANLVSIAAKLGLGLLYGDENAFRAAMGQIAMIIAVNGLTRGLNAAGRGFNKAAGSDYAQKGFGSRPGTGGKNFLSSDNILDAAQSQGASSSLNLTLNSQQVFQRTALMYGTKGWGAGLADFAVRFPTRVNVASLFGTTAYSTITLPSTVANDLSYAPNFEIVKMPK